jgi:hypothetical protein
MANGRIKVAGYAQKIFYENGIEYRNFSPDLVGNQFASNGGSPLFTIGNFVVTTNIDPSSIFNYNLGPYSQFFTLNDLSVNESNVYSLLNENANAILRLDPSSLLTHAYFGSSTEFMRVSLENIIINWPASIYMNPIVTLTDGSELVSYTVTNYQYNPISNRATFNVPNLSINNQYGINYLLNGNILGTFNESNGLRNLTVNYSEYVVGFNDTEYALIGFVPLSQPNSGSLTVIVEGNPFSNTGNTTDQYVVYHIKPNKTQRDLFFNGLNDFEGNLLNTLKIPQYTVTLRYPVESEDGTQLFQTTTLTWPTTDGYNLDYDTLDYDTYVGQLIDIAENSDITRSDLIVRFLVSDSISDFDSVAINYLSDDEPTDDKMKKTLRIYGRAYDDIKRYIDGIAFANTVTYDKVNNTPDIVLKNIARTIGWDLVSSILENNLLQNYVSTSRSTYSGFTRGYTPIESEYEMWRRIIMNSPWIWKSKGHRKVLEFLTKFIGAPSGLMVFNEHVYVAEKPLDANLVQDAIVLNGLDGDLSLYNIDSEGFPKTLADTPEMYFQKNGGWYQETGGPNASIYKLYGNNPHIGPYDGGKSYIDQFRGLIPNFTPVTVTNETILTGTTTLFTNYNQGTLNNYTGATFVDLSSEGFDISDCIVLETNLIPDPKPIDEFTACGCDIATNDSSLKIDVIYSAATIVCDTPVQTGSNITISDDDYYVYEFVLTDVEGATVTTYDTPYVHPVCCKTQYYGNGVPLDYYEVSSLPINEYLLLPEVIRNARTVISTYGGNIYWLSNRGKICCTPAISDPEDPNENCNNFATCNWRLAGTFPSPTFEQATIELGGVRYLKFVDPSGAFRVVSPTGDNCVNSIAESGVFDPFTGQLGFGCKVTISSWGVNNDNFIRSQTYLNRFLGSLACGSLYELPSENTNLAG